MSSEGYLQQRVQECTVSGAGVYKHCPEVGGMKCAVRSYSNTRTHRPELLFCHVFSDILSNPSQGELICIRKSAVSGATRLKEHFLHTFTLGRINCLGNKPLEPASQSSFWISTEQIQAASSTAGLFHPAQAMLDGHFGSFDWQRYKLWCDTHICDINTKLKLRAVIAVLIAEVRLPAVSYEDFPNFVSFLKWKKCALAEGLMGVSKYKELLFFSSSYEVEKHNERMS